MTLTERHFDLIRNAFDSHQRESNDCDDRNHLPVKVLHQSKRKSEQIQRDALLEVNTIYYT